MKIELDEKRKILFWKTAIALQAVEGLETSDELMEIARKNISGEISAKKAVNQSKKIDNENHANLVAARMFEILSQVPQVARSPNEFSSQKSKSKESYRKFLSQETLQDIHRKLFEGISENAGEYRKKNIAKREWALDGELLFYPEAKNIANSLEKILSQEREFCFDNLERSEIAKHIANFISELWQIHPFSKYNTQTVAIFFIEYLEHLGFDFSSEALARNPVYFRNSLVRSAYSDGKKIKADTKYFERLLQNILCGAKNKLNYKAIHIKYDEYGVAIKVEESKPKKKRQGISKKTDSKKCDSPKKKQEKKTRETGVRIKLDDEKNIASESTQKIEKQKKVIAKKAKKTVKPIADETPYIPKDPKVARLCENAQIECNEKIEKILEYLFENKSITNLQARTVADTSTETARKILAKLSESGIVEAQGANRNRVYLLKKSTV